MNRAPKRHETSGNGEFNSDREKLRSGEYRLNTRYLELKETYNTEIVKQEKWKWKVRFLQVAYVVVARRHLHCRSRKALQGSLLRCRAKGSRRISPASVSPPTTRSRSANTSSTPQSGVKPFLNQPDILPNTRLIEHFFTSFCLFFFHSCISASASRNSHRHIETFNRSRYWHLLTPKHVDACRCVYKIFYRLEFLFTGDRYTLGLIVLVRYGDQQLLSRSP